MTRMTLKREEEEGIFKKLLYDGHGSGEDKRLVNLIRNITKFSLVQDSTDTYTLMIKDISAAISGSEKRDLVSKTYDRTFAILENAIEERTKHIETCKQMLYNLTLDMEFAEKLKKVNRYPDCFSTQQAMLDIQRRKQQLIDRIEHQNILLSTLMEACQDLQKIVDDDGPTSVIAQNSESDRNFMPPR